jgi:hypothetical protein
LVSVLEGVNKHVDSAVQAVKVLLHILLLAVEVLMLLVRVEVLQVLVVILIPLCALLVRDDALVVGLVLVLVFLVEPFGVGVLLLHELLSSLQRSSLDVLGGLREQLAELVQVLHRAAHENNIRKDFGRSVLLFVGGVGEGLEEEVALEVVENLIVSEVRVLGKVQDGLVFDFLVVFVVVNLDQTLTDEEHLFDVGLVTNDGFAGVLDAAEHVDDHLVGKASLALLEEVVEGPFELLEDTGVLDEVSLHLGSDLLVEGELFDDQVEVKEESLLDVLSDVVVKGRLNMEWLVGLLNLLDPHVQRIQFFFDEVVEVVGSVENTVNGAHKEGEEGQTQELKGNREDVLVRC